MMRGLFEPHRQTLVALLSSHLPELAQRAAAAAAVKWLWVTIPLTVDDDWIAASLAQPSATDARFYWRDPASGRVAIAYGAAHQVHVDGSDRFGQAAGQWTRHQMDVYSADHRPPVWYGGFAFAAGERAGVWSAWPDGGLLLPRWLVQPGTDGAPGELSIAVAVSPGARVADIQDETLTQLAAFSCVVGPVNAAPARSGAHSEEDGKLSPALAQDEPDVAEQDGKEQAAWQAKVVQVRNEVRAGRFEKLVLARRYGARLRMGLKLVPAALTRLALRFPESYVFAAWQDDQCFLGASPERLIRLEENSVQVDCLAGSAPRGETRQADDDIGQRLLSSTKNGLEHSLVVRWTVVALQPVVQDLQVPDRPRLRKLANVQHLFTPLQGQLANGATVLDLVARLHPTPAVAGIPQSDALPTIRAVEDMDRGWYAGPVGWLNGAGDGEFAVAIRTALVSNTHVHLFAGGGIMGDSDPEAEWAETEWKMHPMRMALGLMEGGERSSR